MNSLDERRADFDLAGLGTWLLVPSIALEATVFPAPTELLFIGLATMARWHVARAFGMVMLGAAIGGAAGWHVGAALIGVVPMHWPGTVGRYANDLTASYHVHPWQTLILSAFKPVPFMAFTVVAGAIGVPLWITIIGAVLGRAVRYGVIGGLSFVVATFVGRDRVMEPNA